MGAGRMGLLASVIKPVSMRKATSRKLAEALVTYEHYLSLSTVKY
jgi:hypothetical protein